jgi:hypothetical protein
MSGWPVLRSGDWMVAGNGAEDLEFLFPPYIPLLVAHALNTCRVTLITRTHTYPCIQFHCVDASGPTETQPSQRSRTFFVTLESSRCPWNQNVAAGLLLLRHVTPLTRRDVVYFHSGPHIWAENYIHV